MKAKLKVWLKAFILHFCPTVYHRRVARHLRGIFRTRFFPFQSAIGERLYGKEGAIRVLSGPFVGMKYFNEVFYFSATPRWLGTYEMELQPAIEEIIQRHYRVIIDVGCAEGYYAVGLALRCPKAQVYAFDVDSTSREQCERLSRLNNVADRVQVGGLLKAQDISRITVLPTLVLCDIEGYELPLLDPQTSLTLKECDLLVEVHEFTDFGDRVEATLQQRFAATHEIQVIMVSPRHVSAVKLLFPAESPTEEMQTAMEEYRPATQHWLWMKCFTTKEDALG